MKRGPCRRKSPGVELVRRAEATREEAPAERRVRDQADAELAQGREDLVLDMPGPQRVLGLDRRDRMDRVGPADRLGARLRESEVADLAGRDELGHRPDGLLDRRVGVDPVLVVEIDVVDPQAGQRSLARLVDVLRTPADRPRRRIARAQPDPELRSQDDLVAPVGDRPPDQPLVGMGSVHVRCVEEVAPQVQRPVDRRRRLGVVGRPVERRHPHAAEADRRDLRSAAAKSPSLHPSLPSWGLRVPVKG